MAQRSTSKSKTNFVKLGSYSIAIYMLLTAFIHTSLQLFHQTFAPIDGFANGLTILFALLLAHGVHKKMVHFVELTIGLLVSFQPISKHFFSVSNICF